MAILLVKWGTVLIGSFVSGKMILPRLAIFLHEANFTRLNYRGEAVPTGGGLLFLLLTPIWMGLALLLQMNNYSVPRTFLFLFVLMGFGLVGFLDDALGGQGDKGFLGHFRALFGGRMTSGALKALYGGAVAGVFAAGVWIFEHPRQPLVLQIFLFLLNMALIGLSANLINLLDLRPGRAGKAFLIGLAVIFFLSQKPELFVLVLPLLAIFFSYIRADLRAWIMLGDVGSNVLGGVLGAMMAWTFLPRTKIIALCLLLSLNVLSERYSFSKIIDRFRVLRFLDHIGRGRTD